MTNHHTQTHNHYQGDDATTESSSLPSSNHKQVRFDERCRVRPIRTLQNLKPQIREFMWYNREELRAIRNDCRSIMKEATHQLQRAQAKQKKKQALQKRVLDVHPPCSSPSSPQQPKERKKNKTKHLFPPSAFRGLEMFHPKISCKRERRRQEQWEAVLTKQAQQDTEKTVRRIHHERSMRRSLKENLQDENDDSLTNHPKEQQQQQHEEEEEKGQSMEEDLLELAMLSISMTQVAAKEAHRRALRDEQDLCHPPKHWMLPWLLVQESKESNVANIEVIVEKKKEVTSTTAVASSSQFEKLLRQDTTNPKQTPHHHARPLTPPLNVSEVNNNSHIRAVT